MDDVLVPSGGFIPITIESYGYIRHNGGTVHRETRGLHEGLNVARSFHEAKERFDVSGENCLLELTTDGGGMVVWMNRDQEETLRKRLLLFNGCYGAWKVRILNQKEKS